MNVFLRITLLRVDIFSNSAHFCRCWNLHEVMFNLNYHPQKESVSIRQGYGRNVEDLETLDVAEISV